MIKSNDKNVGDLFSSSRDIIQIVILDDISSRKLECETSNLIFSGPGERTSSFQKLPQRTTILIQIRKMARLSGLQREVLKLYRACIRSSYKKPAEFRLHWRNYIRSEFEKYHHISKKQFSTIEHLLRVGHRRWEMYLDPQIKDIH